MTPKRFLILLTAVAFAALVTTVAAGASATIAYLPRLSVSSYGPTNPNETRFSTYAQHGSPATAEVDLHIAAGYTPTLTQSPGAQIGTVTGDAEDRGLTASFTTGIVTVADPTAYTNTSCDSAHHDAVWLATLKSSTTTFSFPIFVRTLANQPTELHWCFSRTDPQLATLSFDLQRVIRQPKSGSYRWDARFTPYDAQTGTESSGGQVASLVTVKLPQTASIHVAYSKRTHTYHLTGTATEAGRGTPGAVRIFRSVDGGPFITSRAIGGVPRLTKDGSFAYTGHLSTTKTVRFRAHFVADPPITKSCGKDANGVPCVNASTGGWEKDSNVVAVRP